ncbi:MAG: glycosyltransferase family 2 protein [Planctomycetes bacterium]|nr:glycosyltransferase family 2 protein [Planctomycetota bacterium]
MAELATPPLKLSVVVLSWNTKPLTLACLRALRADTPRWPREVVVIDNGSADGSADAIADQHPEVRLIRNAENVGYAAGNNQGAAASHGEFVCTLNSDTEVAPGALDLLIEYLEAHPEYGAAAPRLDNVDGTVQRACMRFPGLLTALCFDTVFGKFWPGSVVVRRYHMRDFDHLESRDIDQPPGACFMMKRDEYAAMDGLDDELFLFFNDVDICKRLWKAGRRIRYVAEARVKHHGGASTKGYGKFVVVWHRNRMAYYRKHYGPLAVPYMHLLVHLRALEEWWRVGRRFRDPQVRRQARADVRTHVREILAP